MPSDNDRTSTKQLHAMIITCSTLEVRLSCFCCNISANARSSKKSSLHAAASCSRIKSLIVTLRKCCASKSLHRSLTAGFESTTRVSTFELLCEAASHDCGAAQLQCYPLSLPDFSLVDTIFVSISIERALFVPPLPPAIPPSVH